MEIRGREGGGEEGEEPTYLPKGDGGREGGREGGRDLRFLKRESRTASAEASLLKSVDQDTKVWLVAVTGWGREGGREGGKEGGEEGKWLVVVE